LEDKEGVNYRSIYSVLLDLQKLLDAERAIKGSAQLSLMVKKDW